MKYVIPHGIGALVVGLAAMLGGAEPDKEAAPSARRPGAYPPVMTGAREEVYKTVGDVKLKLYIFDPAGRKPADTSPAIVFFFGGGWTGGSPAQFEPQCRYLASRGVVAISADYRVSSRNTIDKPGDCIRDAKSAMRWVRAHAQALGIDPKRIAAGGGSAGGHLAASVAMLDGFEEEGEDRSVSSKPDALVLFNPAVAPPRENPPPGVSGFGRDVWPAYHVKAGLPPTIMFFGTEDTLVGGAKEMEAEMKRAGNRCELVTYEGQRHGFFNYGAGGNKYFLDTLKRADEFLASLGWVKGEPMVDGFKWE